MSRTPPSRCVQAADTPSRSAPTSPAGARQTEVVNDLANALALFCGVSNCQQGLNPTSMGSLSIALCEICAWGCFDEFNRIAPDVLSVTSNHISRTQNALPLPASSLKLDSSREVSLDDKVASSPP